MKRIILFSTPESKNFKKILELTFPKELNNKILAYMPSDGADTKQEYTDIWQSFAKEHDSDFLYIDNSVEEATKEIQKLLSANILVITGGNTFTLLRNLRRSGLDKAVLNFSKKDNFVISGFSAGALVLTPTIKICGLPNFDENVVGLKDLSGLKLVDFEVFPHYSESMKETLAEYRKKTSNEVKEITDDDYLLIEK